MNKDDAPPTRADYPYFSIITTRWMDNDVYGHINNTHYYSFFDTVIAGYLVSEGGFEFASAAVIGLAVESSCRYRRPLAYPEEIHMGLRVAHLGNSSVRYELRRARRRRRTLSFLDRLRLAEHHHRHRSEDRCEAHRSELDSLTRESHHRVPACRRRQELDPGLDQSDQQSALRADRRILHGSDAGAARSARRAFDGREVQHPAAARQRRQVRAHSGHRSEDAQDRLDPAYGFEGTLAAVTQEPSGIWLSDAEAVVLRSTMAQPIPQVASREDRSELFLNLNSVQRIEVLHAPHR